MYDFTDTDNHFTDISPDWSDNKLISATAQYPMRIHLGDYDQDGFVDGLAIVEHGKEKQVRTKGRGSCHSGNVN